MNFNPSETIAMENIPGYKFGYKLSTLLFGAEKGLAKNGWKKPVFRDNTKTADGQLICPGDELVDGIFLGDTDYASKLGRFYRKKDLQKNKIAGQSVKFVKSYTAEVTGGLRKSSCKKLAPVFSKNRLNKAEELQELRDKNYNHLDLRKYQELLANPATNQKAVEDLRLLQAIFNDAGRLDSNKLMAKYEKLMKASNALGLIGTVLGKAAAIGGITDVAASAAKAASGQVAQGARLTTSIADKVSKVSAQLGHIPVNSAIVETLKTGLNASTDVAAKLSSMVLMGIAGSLNPVTGTITALAVVTTIASAGTKIAAQSVKRNEMELQMNKEELLHEIDLMIQNNGTIFYREDNPIFKTAKVIKDKVDTILNSYENDKVFNALNSLTEEEKSQAATFLNAMMTNAANSAYNDQFEQELQKSIEMEHLLNTNVQRQRNRRAKLKRLYKTYKAPKIAIAIGNAVSKNAEISQVLANASRPMAAPAARRATRKTLRKQRI